MSEIVEIKITATVITSRYGSLSPGDILRTDAAYARHLVGECLAAKYVDSGAYSAVEGAQSAAPDPAPRRKKQVK